MSNDRPRQHLRGLTATRLMIISVILFATVAAYSIFNLVTTVDKINKERHDRQVQVSSQIKSLACAVIAPYPDSLAPYVREFRVAYQCPPYNSAILRLLQPPPSAKPRTSTPPRPKPTLRSTITMTVPGQPVPTTTTATTTAPAPPTRTRTVTVAPLPHPTPSRSICVLNVCLPGN